MDNKIQEKICNQCKIKKEINCFNIHHKNANGSICYRSKCKKCIWEIEKKRRDSKRIKPKQRYNKIIDGMKICSKCGKNKSIGDYHFMNKKNQIRPECINCEKKYNNYRRNINENKEKMKKYNQTIQQKYKSYAKKAYKRNFNFDLTIEEFAKLTRNKNCYLCNDFYKIIGIDRIDSKKGYVKNNCLSCCTDCNYAKLNTPLKDFYKLVEKIYKNKPIFFE